MAALPRATLLARFGPLVLERLDRASGAAPEAIAGCALPDVWHFESLLEHPTARRETIELVLDELVGRACQALARKRYGMLRLECRFEPERGPAASFVVGLYRPSAAPRHIGELVRLKLDRLRFREPLAAVGIRVLALDRLELRQQAMAFVEPETISSPRQLAALVDRLSNRLGSHAVTRPWLLADAQPEFACQYQPLRRACPPAAAVARSVRPASRRCPAIGRCISSRGRGRWKCCRSRRKGRPRSFAWRAATSGSSARGGPSGSKLPGGGRGWCAATTTRSKPPPATATGCSAS